ncbi:MAG: carotenoid oxygenase family protein [Gammaproteobacteria bacterium]|nr:carotenoid oxygenase family protein [Gammaproteobacteria bacterium]
MSESKLNLSKAYTSQSDEITLDNLRIDGDIPTWLSGSFVSNGPGQFEVGGTHFNHWFDGFAMLKKFEFKSGTVRFQNRFLQSTEYVKSNKQNQLNINEFGTYASTSKIGRIACAIKELIQYNTHDNCVVNTACIAEHYIAMTESKDMVSFNLDDLSTTGTFHFTDTLPGHLTTAHPHLDVNTHELINISIEIGKITQYHIDTIEPLTKTRKRIQTYQSDNAFYIHSFSLTNNYIILFKSPLVINKVKLMLGFPFNHTLAYQENTSSFFIVIDRNNGKIVEIEAPPFVCLHSINAYEFENKIMLDLVCHASGNPYDNLYLSNLRSSHPTLSTGKIKRYTINLHSKNCKQIIISNSAHEFPRINYMRCNGKHYQFVYTTLLSHSEDLFFNQVQKLNVQTGSTQCWGKPNYYLGEAVFVAKNHHQQEDEGVLLFIAFNAITQLSSLIIIDALSMQCLAEVYLPLHLPFGLHGHFYK